MLEFGIAVIVTIFHAICFLGYGRLFNLTQPNRSFTLGQCLATGVCVYIALCGVLEVTASASAGAFYVLDAIGALAAFLYAVKHPPVMPHVGIRVDVMRAKPWLIAAGGVLATLFVMFVINAGFWDLGADDVHGYLQLPLRILQEGNASQDPFIYRRIEMGLGGANYLYASALAYTDFTTLGLVDFGFGMALLVLLIVEQSVAISKAILLLTLYFTLFLLVEQPTVNLSPDVISVALSYALATMLFQNFENGTSSISRGFLVGLYIFGIISLKTTYGILAATVFFAAYASKIRRGTIRQVAKEVLVAGACCFALMLPWMYTAYKDAGTPFFPFLGTGTLSAVEFGRWAAWHGLWRTYLRDAACVALPLTLMFVIMRSSVAAGLKHAAALLTVISCGLTAYAAAKVTTGFQLHYLFPEIMLFTLLALMFFNRSQLPWRRWYLAMLLLSAISVSYAHTWQDIAPRILYKGALYTIARDKLGWLHGGDLRGPRGPDDLHVSLDQEAISQRTRALQFIIPPKATALALLDAPVFLDYRRNRLYTMDLPGMISPPPGLPASNEPKDWLAYLAARHIDYVLYTIGLGGVPVENKPQQDLSQFPWLEAISQNFFRVSAVLKKLNTVCVTIFSDGRSVVLDCRAGVKRQTAIKRR